MLGLRAAGGGAGSSALSYLVAHEAELTDVTDVELAAMAETVLGRRPERLLTRIRAARKPSGRIGPGVNSTTWGVLALRQAREKPPRAAIRYLVRAHVDNALMFVDTLAEDLSFDRAIDTYIREMSIPEPLASTVATRTLVVLGQDLVPYRRRAQESDESDRPKLRLGEASEGKERTIRRA